MATVEAIDDKTHERQPGRIGPVPSRKDVAHGPRRKMVQLHQGRSHNAENKSNHEREQLSSEQQAECDDLVPSLLIFIHGCALDIPVHSCGRVAGSPLCQGETGDCPF